ncbi:MULTISPECIES: rhodanese-like domain-containing protein [Prochlorococcus]|uniref:rhodanese-like domain-containing protein n=1 Tax=Prochlorococcus TaxID=1218 RepID=UPI000533BD03|nr:MULTISPECIES: rhodanese-like domain-containing protein [Prochlorococcus]KGG13210.1 rhodanese-like [Prochlorococcus sp. MIT 0601]
MNQKVPRNITAIDLDKWLRDEPEKPVLVDVREDNEIEIANLPHKVEYLPLSRMGEVAVEFLSRLSSDQSVVIFCHSGIRSWNFGCWMIEQGCNCEVWNLLGGIDAWSEDVDRSIPRY